MATVSDDEDFHDCVESQLDRSNNTESGTKQVSTATPMRSSRIESIKSEGEIQNLLTNQTDRAALGRVAYLGDLYDARTDSFTGLSIFRHRELLDKCVRSMDTSASSAKYIFSENFAEKFNELDINPQLKLSILGGLITLEGSGKYLKEEKTTKRTLSVSLHYSQQTKSEQLFYDVTFSDHINLNVLNQLNAGTHVVSKIDWGANFVITATDTKYDGKNENLIKGNLKGKLPLPKAIKVEGGLDNSEVADGNVNLERDFSYSMMGDIELESGESLPSDVDGIQRVISRVPQMIKKVNDGKGKPIKYTLIPISMVRRILNLEENLLKNTIADIEEHVIVEIVHFFDEIYSVYQELNDLTTDVNHASVLMQELREVTHFKSQFETRMASFRKCIHEKMVSIRSGRGISTDLIDDKNAFIESDYSPDKVREFIRSFDFVISKIQFIDGLRQRGIQYFVNPDDFDSWLVRNSNSDLYVLCFEYSSRLADIILWDNTRNIFIKLVEDQNEIMSANGNPDTSGNNASQNESGHLVHFAIFDWKNGDPNAKPLTIRHYFKDEVIYEDFLQRHDFEKTISLAKSSNVEHVQYSVGKRAPLVLPCPGTIRGHGHCDDEPKQWHCFHCNELLEFGFDGKVYCKCGRAQVVTLRYKCDSDRHSTKYIPYPQQNLQIHLKKLEPFPEYNILLLGESGAGKSTTVNAFANYLKYSTFEKAASNEFVQLIPSNFTMPHPETGEPYIIETGTDDNERHGGGQSSTRSPMGYHFWLGDRMIRIIDTPGIGDTSGVNADKENFQKILDHLHYHKKLQGICILVKSTETRKTTTFRYCINELLTHLHKSACKNIVFCFTFSRNSFYGPGEGFSTLRGFLQNELSGVDLELSTGVNCFFVDNEAFRFLAAKKKGHPFAENQERSYEESWIKSVEQTKKMMLRLLSLEPHNLEHTSCLNNARKLILELAEPMVRLKMNIDANIAHIRAEQTRLRNSNEAKESLARNLHLEVEDLEARQLDYPSTVCTSDKCVEVVNFQGVVKINYKTRCHENCRLSNVETNKVGHPKLQGCWAMSGTLNCTKKCGCSWQKHMHLTCDYDKVKRSIIDSNVQREIRSKEDAIRVIEEGLEKMERLVEEYKRELDVINDVTSKFAYILINNSNTPYNKYIEPYMDSLIDEEQKKMNAVPNYPRTNYDSLINMKAQHQNMVKVLTEAIRNKSQEEVKIEDIHKFRNQLLQLKHSGSQFSQMLDTFQLVRLRALEYRERPGLNPSDYSDGNSFTDTLLGSVHGPIYKRKEKMYKFFKKFLPPSNSSSNCRAPLPSASGTRHHRR